MYEYNDKRKSAGRTPRLYLAKGGEVVRFQGSNIPGFVAIATSEYKKDGKWSNTTYQLDLVPGVRPIYFLSPMHGIWGDNLSSWGKVAKELGLPVEVAKELVGAEYPTTAERLDKLEEFSLAIEAQGNQNETVIVSFGSPTNREMDEGFWESPKSSQTSNGKVVTVGVGKGDDGWNKPVVVEPDGAKIFSSRSSPGMHGGYRTIEVIVPI